MRIHFAAESPTHTRSTISPTSDSEPDPHPPLAVSTFTPDPSFAPSLLITRIRTLCAVATCDDAHGSSDQPQDWCKTYQSSTG
ncbi:hypothetical protein BGW80DRAFT_1315229 [Lactifluus volemus]|nr:hypothetical protein BGW80DRAFT_1315229 [Lactifluus volemus]